MVSMLIISVYTGLYRIIKIRFHLYVGALLDDVSLEKYYSLNIWVNHQTCVSSPRICLVPADSAQPSCFPDGPWRLESFWKQSLRANVLHLRAFRAALERALSALERRPASSELTVTNTGSSFVSEVCQISVNGPVVAVNCCLLHLLLRPAALGLCCIVTLLSSPTLRPRIPASPLEQIFAPSAEPLVEWYLPAVIDIAQLGFFQA